MSHIHTPAQVMRANEITDKLVDRFLVAFRAVCLENATTLDDLAFPVVRNILLGAPLREPKHPFALWMAPRLMLHMGFVWDLAMVSKEPDRFVTVQAIDGENGTLSMCLMTLDELYSRYDVKGVPEANPLNYHYTVVNVIGSTGDEILSEAANLIYQWIVTGERPDTQVFFNTPVILEASAQLDEILFQSGDPDNVH